MYVLGIDTSCDDTCAALLEVKKKKFKVLSNIVSSQVKLHAKYGGVYPSLAKREHQKNLPLVLKKALKNKKLKEIDLLGVTTGPGLEPCLWQGVNFIKELAEKEKLPVVPINHIEAHILANFIERGLASVKLPAVCLVVSGGHTLLILMKKIGQYEILGETRDDAAGECFDKVARILGLAYPGGPVIAKLASQWKYQTSNPKLQIELPRPMIHQKNYDFSFSGLKTAVLYDFKSRSLKIRKSDPYVKEMCFETQQAIIDVLIKKTIKAAKDFRVKSIIAGGGVMANSELRKQLKERIKKEIPENNFYCPDLAFCTDNAVMVAMTAYFHREKTTKNWKNLAVDANLKI